MCERERESDGVCVEKGWRKQTSTIMPPLRTLPVLSKKSNHRCRGSARTNGWKWLLMGFRFVFYPELNIPKRSTFFHPLPVSNFEESVAKLTEIFRPHIISACTILHPKIIPRQLCEALRRGGHRALGSDLNATARPKPWKSVRIRC